jgi:hypothetical protein
MATNNAGHLLDDAGNVFVDFVWGSRPLHPNDVRVEDADSPVVVVAADADQNYDWSGYSVYPSERLNPSLDNHEIAISEYSGYPGFTPSAANYIVTAVSADGTTITYTSQNNFKAGELVTITGIPTAEFNLTEATIASADAVKFTVTSATTGAAVTGVYYGRAENVTNPPADGAYVDGVVYVDVPNVLGFTTASATDALKDVSLVPTTATAATNAAKEITAITRTAGETNLVYTASAHGLTAGSQVTISNTGTSAYNGTKTIASVATDTFTVVTTATSAVAVTEITGSVVGVAGTVKSQSIAAGAATIAVGAAITITPYAAAS